jgi:hypothetical protein
MLTRSRWVWVAGLFLAGCYSPSYHDGDLQCTPSGQCPKDYHCAANNTCWHNGRDPDAGLYPPNSDASVSPDALAPAGDAPGDGPVDAAMQTSPPDASLPGNPDSGCVAVPLDQLANAYALVVCSNNFTCCTQADLKGKSLATCRSDIVSQVQPGIQAISDGIGRGRTVYYPDQACQCLQGIAAVSCASWPMNAGAGLPAGCNAIVAPQAASGRACRSAVECITGFCSGATSTADGTCLPRAASGENCAQVLFQNSCQDGLSCDSTSICSATKPEGAVCTRARDCTSQTCGGATDAGSVCQPAACYSSGPFVAAGCSMGGRPAAIPGVILVTAGAALFWRRRSRPTALRVARRR